MYVAKVPNRGSPPAVLLRESYREAGKVKNRTLANLSSWPEAKVEALARALKGLPPAGLEGTFEIARSLPHGHVAAVLGTARQLGLEELIDPAPSRHRDLVMAMAVTWLWMVYVGQWVRSSGRRELLEAKNKQDYSVFRLGRDWVRRALALGWPIPVGFTIGP